MSANTESGEDPFEGLNATLETVRSRLRRAEREGEQVRQELSEQKELTSSFERAVREVDQAFAGVLPDVRSLPGSRSVIRATERQELELRDGTRTFSGHQVATVLRWLSSQVAGWSRRCQAMRSHVMQAIGVVGAQSPQPRWAGTASNCDSVSEDGGMHNLFCAHNVDDHPDIAPMPEDALPPEDGVERHEPAAAQQGHDGSTSLFAGEHQRARHEASPPRQQGRSPSPTGEQASPNRAGDAQDHVQGQSQAVTHQWASEHADTLRLEKVVDARGVRFHMVKPEMNADSLFVAIKEGYKYLGRGPPPGAGFLRRKLATSLRNEWNNFYADAGEAMLFNFMINEREERVVDAFHCADEHSFLNHAELIKSGYASGTMGDVRMLSFLYNVRVRVYTEWSNEDVRFDSTCPHLDTVDQLRCYVGTINLLAVVRPLPESGSPFFHFSLLFP